MNNPKVTCFAHRHMTFAEYGLYSHLREVSSKSVPKYTYRFDDRTLAERFAHERGCSKDTVNRLRRSLALKGFISWLEPQKRVAGRYMARLGRILSHMEWAERHPGKCIHDILEGEIPPVSSMALHQSQVADHQSHSEARQSQIQPSPVSNEAAHQSRQRDISIHTDKSIKTIPSLGGMAPTENLNQPTLDSANRQSHSRASLNADTGEGLPVSEARQVPLGLENINGEWFTESGVKLHPDAVAVLFGKEIPA